jgi:hypothetical protein
MASAGFEPTTVVLPGVRDAGQPAGDGARSGVARPPGPSLDEGPNNSARCARVRVLNSETGETLGLPCKSWRCDRCSVRNRRAFSKRLRLGLAVPGSEIPKLLTLTSQPGEMPHVSRARLARRFADLRRRVLRMCPAATVEYAGVVERTQRGAIHFHVVLRGVPFVPQSRWSTMAAASGFGYVVDIRAANVRVGPYLTKALGEYLTKEAASSSWGRHFRRIRFSQRWAPEWVPRPARAAHGGAPVSPWSLLRIDPPGTVELRQLETAGAGQGPP